MKVVATAGLLLAHGALVLGLDLVMGISVGASGVGAWFAWTSSHDPTTAAVLLALSSLQLLALLASTFAAGFQVMAAIRATRGEPRALRSAALTAIGVPALWVFVALFGMSCVFASFWTVPLVLGCVGLALAREVDEELDLARRDW